jgi:hypothetical protein
MAPGTDQVNSLGSGVLRLGWHVGQAYQARMSGAAMDQPPEVGVDGDQNAALARRQIDDRLVTRIWPQPRHLDHVVSLRPQLLRQAVTGTSIDEESYLATWTASRESSARTAWA